MPYLQVINPDGTVCRKTNGYSVKRLWEKHKEICRLLVLGQFTDKEIAKIVGVTPQTVYNIKGSEKGKAHMEYLSLGRDKSVEDIQERLAQIAPMALETLEEVLTDEAVSIPVKVGVAKDLLDRAGHKPVSKVSINSVSTRVDSKFLQEIKQRAAELKVSSSNIEEAVVLQEEQKENLDDS